MSLRTKYALLKAITIVVGALSIPWSTFVGFCFGEGRYFTGVVALCAQTVVSLIDGYIWFWVLENMRDKMREDACQQCTKNTAQYSRLHAIPSDSEAGNLPVRPDNRT